MKGKNLADNLQRDTGNLIRMPWAEDAEKAVDARKLSPKQLDDLIKELTAEMKRASKNLDFEYAATLRDRIKEIQAQAKGVK